jgi:hypothetical protein
MYGSNLLPMVFWTGIDPPLTYLLAGPAPVSSGQTTLSMQSMRESLLRARTFSAGFCKEDHYRKEFVVWLPAGKPILRRFAPQNDNLCAVWQS